MFGRKKKEAEKLRQPTEEEIEGGEITDDIFDDDEEIVEEEIEEEVEEPIPKRVKKRVIKRRIEMPEPTAPIRPQEPRTIEVPVILNEDTIKGLIWQNNQLLKKLAISNDAMVNLLNGLAEYARQE